MTPWLRTTGKTLFPLSGTVKDWTPPLSNERMETYMFEILVMLGLWLAILGATCLYDEFKKQYRAKPSPKKDKKTVDKEPNL